MERKQSNNPIQKSKEPDLTEDNKSHIDSLGKEGKKAKKGGLTTRVTERNGINLIAQPKNQKPDPTKDNKCHPDSLRQKKKTGAAHKVSLIEKLQENK